MNMVNFFHNIINTKKGLLTSILSITLITSYSIASNLNESQAKNYIQNLIDTLFNPNNHSGSYERTLKNFSYNATQKILNKVGKYEDYLSFNKIYNTDLIYQELINESVNFIENCAKQYAKDEIGKFYYASNVNENAIINLVAKSVKQEVTTLINTSTYLNSSTFTSYYGVDLLNKVHKLIAKELKAYAAQNQKPTYPTNECPICFEDFGFYIKRLFLSCGHNICAGCLKQWYNEKGSNTTCPMCRAKINIKDLIKEL